MTAQSSSLCVGFGCSGDGSLLTKRTLNLNPHRSRIWDNLLASNH